MGKSDLLRQSAAPRVIQQLKQLAFIAHQPNRFPRKSSQALKRMHLPKLYMALALVRLRDHTLELVGAGMPPALVYRAASGCVEKEYKL